MSQISITNSRDLICKISQTSTSEPSFSKVSVNDFCETPTFTYSGVGSYVLSFVRTLEASDTYIYFRPKHWVNTKTLTEYTIYVFQEDESNFRILSYDANGDLSNDILDNFQLIIREYF